MNKYFRGSRYANQEGHTDICYSDDGRYIITCGSDGDIRIFEGIDDDDPKTHSISNSLHCIAYRDNCLVVGTDLNMIQSYTFDGGEANGIITRFTSFPTHINISSDKNIIAAGSRDMTIKVHDIANYKDTTFAGHEASVLSVAIDPKGDFLASSSCDGTVRIWNFRTQSLVRSFTLLPKCNSFESSKTLCRLNFTPEGNFLIIPVEYDLVFYNRDWKVDFKLHNSNVNSTISVTAVSPCGNFVAGGCRDGLICVWSIKHKSCLFSEKSTDGYAITGLVWKPNCNGEMAYVNIKGEMGTVEKFLDSQISHTSEQSSVAEPISKNAEQIAPSSEANEFDNASDDESEISLARIKALSGFADDEEGTYIGTQKENDVDDMSRASSRMDIQPPPPIVAPKLPDPQRPFQPGMSPEHLKERYMVWNNTGIVRQYQSDVENSIEVEFHDSSIHHPLHLSNHIGFSMSSLNHQALILAAESQEDQLSKLSVHYFSAWDGSKEWESDMPEGEDILAVGTGNNFVYVATDKRNLRVFSMAGVQRDLFSIPGPIVCLAGWENHIMIAYHCGMGVIGEQCISIMILDVNGKKHLMPSPVQVALSPNSFLAWAGFSDEGTPIIMDSAGMVKLLNMKIGPVWTCVLNTKKLAKGKGDHYFLIGASEVQGVIRCILCKGSRYPLILPRPHVMLLELQIPLCEISSEKGCLEESLMRTKLLSVTVENLSRQGLDVEATQRDLEKRLKENMLKLFALACRSDRESRALEVCEAVPSYEMIDLAIKYATKIHRMQLAERLSEVVQQKMEARLQEETQRSHFKRLESDSFNNDYDNENSSHCIENFNQDSQVSQYEEGGIELERNPLLAASSRRFSKHISSHAVTISPTLRNPFKKSQTLSSASKGLELIDTFKNNKKEAPILRPVIKKPKNKQSNSPSIVDKLKVLAVGKENEVSNVEVPTSIIKNNIDSKVTTPLPKKPSALKLWLEDNKALMKEKFADASETELLVKAAILFKDVDDATKQKYKVLASNYKASEAANGSESDDKKRRTDTESVNQPVEKKQKSGISKLSAFAFNKLDNSL